MLVNTVDWGVKHRPVLETAALIYTWQQRQRIGSAKSTNNRKLSYKYGSPSGPHIWLHTEGGAVGYLGGRFAGDECGSVDDVTLLGLLGEQRHLSSDKLW